MAKITGKTYVLVPEGKTTLTLREVKMLDNRFWKPGESEEKKIRLQWFFDVDDVQDAEVTKFSSSQFGVYKGKQSNALALTEALLGRKLANEEVKELDTDILVGRKMNAMIVHELREDGRTFNDIDSFGQLEY